MSKKQLLLAPFPYFGGKKKIVQQVWKAFGDIGNYVEPFFGSGAVLLNKPRELNCCVTVNDIDGYICNFWRAVKHNPEEVLEYADWPVSEADLHPRHYWLKNQRESLTEKLMGDEAFYDTKIAGWWLWGICIWIGSGFCSKSGDGPWHIVGGRLVKPEEVKNGIKKKLPHIGDKITRKLFIRNWLNKLQEEMRDVRVACGDWKRVVGKSPTVIIPGITGVFLDPPYEGDSYKHLYEKEEEGIFTQTRQWAIENGNNPKLRIALCGLNFEMPEGWKPYYWERNAGFGNQGAQRGKQKTAKNEVVWFSPNCYDV